jgi:hypothetical protein
MRNPRGDDDTGEINPYAPPVDAEVVEASSRLARASPLALLGAFVSVAGAGLSRAYGEWGYVALSLFACGLCFGFWLARLRGR